MSGTILILIGVFWLGMLAGFLAGVSHGTRKEYRVNQQTMIDLERWRRNHANR